MDKYVAERSRQKVMVNLGKGKKKATNRNIKRSTIHRELSDIRAILRWSVKRRFLSANPMEGFVFPTRDDAIIQPPTGAEKLRPFFPGQS